MGIADREFKQDEALRRRDTQTEREPAVTPLPDETARWQRWIEEYVAAQLVVMDEVIGRAIAMERRDFRAALKTEVDLIRRELDVLRTEVGVRNLQSEVAAARADVPKLPDIEARVSAKQTEMRKEIAHLKRELAQTKDRLAYARVDIGQVEFGLKQLEKKPPTVEIKMQTRDSQFTLKDDDPETSALWRQFVAQAFADNARGAAVSVAGHILSPAGYGNGASN